MWLSRASAIGSMPSSRAATADRTGRIHAASAAGSSVSIARISATVRSAPSRSALLTTCTSAISRTPALSAWTSSPRPGTETTITVWARRITSTSSCPTPTVSTRTRLRPAASMRSTASAAARQRPPRAPRVAIERMKTPGSRARSFMRIRSPRIAPPENGEEGSTATTPTVRPRARATSASPRTSVLFPLPGPPVTPTIWARPVWGYRRVLRASARCPPDSAHVSPRARARVEPSTIWLASVSTSKIIVLSAILRHRPARGARTSDLGDGRCGPAAGRSPRSTRQCEAELPAALPEGVAVEPEQPGGLELIAARQLERMDQQRTLEELEGVAIDPPGARGRQLGDEWRGRICGTARQPPQNRRGVGIDPPGARGRQLGDEWRDRIGDQARQRAETGRVFAAVMFFGHSVASTLRPPSVGQRQADGPDWHESITARVDPLEVAVEHQELHPALGGPAPEFCGNELEGHGDERPPREVSDR